MRQSIREKQKLAKRIATLAVGRGSPPAGVAVERPLDLFAPMMHGACPHDGLLASYDARRATAGQVMVNPPSTAIVCPVT